MSPHEYHTRTAQRIIDGISMKAQKKRGRIDNDGMRLPGCSKGGETYQTSHHKHTAPLPFRGI